MADSKPTSSKDSSHSGGRSRYPSNLILPTSRPIFTKYNEEDMPSTSRSTGHSDRTSRNFDHRSLIRPTSQPEFLRRRSSQKDHSGPVRSWRDDPNPVASRYARSRFGSSRSIASDSSISSRLGNHHFKAKDTVKRALSRNSIDLAVSDDKSKRFARDSSHTSSPNRPDIRELGPRKRERHFGYRFLEELSKKESHEIVVEIAKVDAPFDTYLDKSEMEPDWLFLLMKIVGLACQSHLKGNRCEILGKLCNSQILTLVSNYLGDVALESKECRVKNLSNFMGNLYEFFNCLVNTMPMMAVEKDLRKTILKMKMAIDNVNRHLEGVTIDEVMVKQLDVLLAKYDDHLQVVQKRLPSEKHSSYVDRIANCAPPENFRELSLYPSYEDITRKHLGFVRPNKISGAYDDVEHYLDVQFRLLREDFIDPLRKGLRKYTQSKSEPKTRSKFKYDNVRIYPDTRFVQVKNSKSHHMGILLNFDPNNKMKNMKWDRSKRFMHGSLLMFTADDFRTFFYGTVLERSLQDLRDGNILVNLTEDALVGENFFKNPFLMAESEVFFKPYDLVLKLLKELDDSTFPMKKYIVEGKSTTEHPSYLAKFNSWILDSKRVNPTDIESWPTASELGLDSFQHRAFVAALTQDFCVIQGPPGTGKTFLGLKIVRTILKNAKSLDPPVSPPSPNRVENDMEDGDESDFSEDKILDPAVPIYPPRPNLNQLDTKKLKLPILVVCYTNHALDQFLEGMLNFTKNLIRVGGQSRSEILQKYNLRGRQTVCFARRSSASRSVMITRDVIRDIRESINGVTVARKSCEKAVGILHVELLKDVVPKRFHFLLHNDEEFLNWLLDGNCEDRYLGPDRDFQNYNFEYHSMMQMEDQAFAMTEEEEEELENHNIVDEDELFDPRNLTQDNFTCNYSVTVESLGNECENLIAKYQSLRDTAEYYRTELPLRRQIELRIRQFHNLKENIGDPSLKNSPEASTLFHRNPTKLPIKSRWTLYWLWVRALQESLAKKLEGLERSYRNKISQYEEFKQMDDLNLVQSADIVGMTTTCAASMNLLLKSLKPAVVVVEEAAEVLETHIVTSLTKECQHVILIGDHEQLRPSAAVYELSKTYNIDVSLFERMIKNGLNCPVLNVQHRMRPEISCLITPLIYPDLKNHDSVLQYESIRGVDKNVFFLDHRMPEQVNDDTVSKQNLHEAEFTIKFARYLMLQGYESEKITILTTYTGQMFLMRDLQRDQFFAQHVKCIVVDKYQGEENDIILLSLVRSNSEGKIGFLNIKNRVCVALSRARKGLFIIGNMECLTKDSELWRNIEETLQKNNAIGQKMQLHCSIHEKSTLVQSADDFKNVREGGCDNYCNELMKCGHHCQSLCHPTNRDHEQIRCREPCKKTCPRNLHPCNVQCFEECPKCLELVEFTLPCKHIKKLACYVKEDEYKCNEVVDDISPWCNHPIKRRCHQKPEEGVCSFPCEDRLDCGHVCTRYCHKLDDPDHSEFKCLKPCDKLNELCSEAHTCEKLCHEACGKCSIVIDVTLPCGHQSKLACSTDLTSVKCKRKCDKICPQCHKKCRKLCHEDCNPCPFEIKKKIPECGHEVKIRCYMEPKREYCRQKCDANAPCGHKCNSMCCKPCGSEKCLEIVQSSAIKPLCGHELVTVFCYRKDEVPQMNPEYFLNYCSEPCNTILECGDLCEGTCGKCWQGRLHWTCQKRCGKILICGHSCKSPCSRLCPPCNEPCTFRCPHSRCPRKCGVPCVSCKEPCGWKCEHMKCTRKCGQPCDRKPCEKPCPLKIPTCGHDCIGFCGEPCPPLCRICDPEVTEILFGYEDELDARFVLLVDCNHTIESKALEQHLSTAPEGGEIVMKICPLCKTPITKTLRYMSYVKQTYKHIINVKKKIFGNCDDINKEIKTLMASFKNMRMTDLSFFFEIPELIHFIQNCHRKLCDSSRKFPLSEHEVSSINFYYQALDSIISRQKDFVVVDTAKAPHFGPILPEPGLLFQEPQPRTRWDQRAPPRRLPQPPTPRSRPNRVVTRTLEMVDKDRVFDFLKNFIFRLEKTNWRINRQRILDFLDELNRYHAMIGYCRLRSDPSYAPYKEKPEIRSLCTQLEDKIFGRTKFGGDLKSQVEDLLKKLQTEVKNRQTLVLDEKRMINEAMSRSFGSLTAGRWYTCPQGHYYCVTECGMARQTAQCPECKSTIGQGSNYRERMASNLA